MRSRDPAAYRAVGPTDQRSKYPPCVMSMSRRWRDRTETDKSRRSSREISSSKARPRRIARRSSPVSSRRTDCTERS